MSLGSFFQDIGLAPSIPQSTFNQQNAYASQAAGIPKKAKKEALGYIDTGTSQAQPYLQNAVDLLNVINQDRQNASVMYQNSLGLNGPEGNQAALSAYQASPMLEIANQNYLRNRANLGALNSGESGIGLQRIGAEQYGSWQDRLQGLDPLEAARSQGSALTNLGQLFSNAGSNKANVVTGLVQPAMSGLQNQAALLGQQANMTLGAQQQGISNALGLIGLPFKAAGQAGGFGNLFSFGA